MDCVGLIIFNLISTGGQGDPQNYKFAYKSQTVYAES